MTGTVLSERRDGVSTITLNRPERLNAISSALAAELGGALRAAQADPESRAIVLRGAGRAFCAGDDLKEFESHSRDPAAARRHLESIQEASRAIVLGDKMVVGAIHGWAAGGGLEWAIDCDLPIMAEGTRCFFPEVALGLVVTGGITAILPRVVGQSKARELILFGEKFGAREALAMGIAWKVVPEKDLFRVAHETARRIAELPQRAVRDLKRVINRASALDVEGAMALETEACFARFLDSEVRERARAFAERPKKARRRATGAGARPAGRPAPRGRARPRARTR